MIAVDDLVDKFDGQLASRRYDASGEELFSSRIRRAVEAHALQQKLEREDPRLRVEREAGMATAKDDERKRRIDAHEQAFWEGMPAALRATGLRDQELQVVAGMDESWPAWQAIDAWAKGDKLFLTMGGQPGSGKTIAGCWLLAQRCREHVRCESFEGWFWRPAWGRFAKASELARFSYYDTNDRRYLERLGLVRWLVLDDLGAELMSDGWRATLFELLETRSRNRCRTLLTTNLSGEELRTRYEGDSRNGRLMRRLRDFGAFAAAVRPEARAA